MNITLLKFLLTQGENEWIEFKKDKPQSSESIGEYISALANSAALHNISKAYLVYGVDDITHEVIGTTFEPKRTKIGNEEIESWLHRLLEPQNDFIINNIVYNEKRVVIFEIDPAKNAPVSFSGREFIRVGSYKKPLKEFPEKERKLWQVFSAFCFEDEIAKSGVTINEVLSLLDILAFFKLLKIPYNEYSTSTETILSNLIQYEIVISKNNTLHITNLGAILFAKNLDDFKSLSRKRVRVIKYKGTNKLNTEFEQEGSKGYAVGFQGLIKFIIDKLPKNEVIKEALRQETTLYPEIAIRELVANALIHQDFTITGTNPMIEIYDDRIEITNNGKPLIEVNRLIDYKPISRNEKLAKLMRLMGICEERGSGIDKVISAIETYQLPAPSFRTEDNYFKVTIFAPLPFEKMDKQNRIRATYQHTCLKFTQNDFMTNSSLRQRFNLSEKQHSKASQIIKDTLETQLIKPADPENKSTKHIKYTPYFG